MICSHCLKRTGSGIWSGKMPFLCKDCYKKWERIWLEFITKKYPNGIPFWYLTWHEMDEKAKLCREWNEPHSKEKVVFT